MLKGPIPPHVDPRKLADRAATLTGELQLSQLKRLADPLEDDQGVVRASFPSGATSSVLWLSVVSSTLKSK